MFRDVPGTFQNLKTNQVGTQTAPKKRDTGTLEHKDTGHSDTETKKMRTDTHRGSYRGGAEIHLKIRPVYKKTVWN